MLKITNNKYTKWIDCDNYSHEQLEQITEFYENCNWEVDYVNV